MEDLNLGLRDVRKLTVTIVNKNTKVTKTTIGLKNPQDQWLEMVKIFITLKDIQRKVLTFFLATILCHVVPCKSCQ